MKFIARFLYIMSSLFSIAQAQTTIIKFTMNKNKTVLFDDHANLSKTSKMLPIKLVFDTSFAHKKISFYLTDTKGALNLISEGQFDDDYGKANGTNNYEINFKSDAMIDPDLNDNKVILSSRKFYFTIDTSSVIYGPFNVSSYITTYETGSIIKDALKLSEIRNQIGNDSLSRLKLFILKSYGIRNKSTLDANQFLKSLFEDLFDKSLGFVESDAVNTANPDFLSAALSSVGGLDVTNIADGFAKFIVKRTKEELSITFFEKFKKELEKYPDLKTVFPNTFNLLEAIDREIYNYSNYINNLREAFRSDLQVIDENLPGIVTNHPDFFKKKNNFELGLALQTGCYVSTSLRHDVHSGDILEGYPLNFFDVNKMPSEDTSKLIALKGSIQSLQLLSESLKEVDTLKHSYWVGIDKIRQLVNNKDAFKIYIGLLLQVAHTKYVKVKFSSSENFYDKLNTKEIAANFDDDYTAYKQYILAIGTKVNELNKMIKEYEKPTTDSLKVEQYAKYFKSSVQFLHFCIQVTTLPHINKIPVVADLDKKTQNYFDIAFETSDLATAIIRKRYPEAVNHLIVIYNKIVTKPSLTSATVLTTDVKLTNRQRKELTQNLISANASNPKTTTNLVVNNYSEIRTSISSDQDMLTKQQINKLADTLIQMNAMNPAATTDMVIASVKNVNTLINSQNIEFTNSSKVLASLAKYGSFMSSMVYAKNSDEVANAIEAVALPVGSSKIKRETPFNVSINAYCGLFVGNEVIKGVDRENPFYKFNAFGVTAPIGISISRGNDYVIPYILKRTNHRYGWSHSLFISLIDLGAVTAFRFTDETTDQVPTIQLKDIFSPGLFWSIGVPKTPLSVNLGTQVGPNLRKVNITGGKNDFSGNTYMRYSISVCVDLPILNLYSKSR